MLLQVSRAERQTSNSERASHAGRGNMRILRRNLVSRRVQKPGHDHKGPKVRTLILGIGGTSRSHGARTGRGCRARVRLNLPRSRPPSHEREWESCMESLVEAR